MIAWIAALVPSTSARLIISGLLLMLAAAGGASLMADFKDGEIARLEASHSAESERATQAGMSRLIKAQKRGDDLQISLSAVEAARQTLDEEKSNAVRRLTVGRPCLDSVVVRLLNQPAGVKPAAVPETAGEPAGTDATFATDTDVGLWIGTCQRSYDTCRGRLQAVAEFFREDAPE